MVKIFASVLVAAAFAGSPVFATECHYEADDYITAVSTDDGYEITYGDGTKDYCRDESAGPETLARIAKCDQGWEGVIFFAGATLRNIEDSSALMVLMNTVFYRVCPPAVAETADNRPMDIELGN